MLPDGGRMYRRIFFGPGLYSRSVDFSAVGSLDEDYVRSWNGKERGKSCSASLSRLRGKIFLSFFLCDQFKNFVRKYIYLGTIDNFSPPSLPRFFNYFIIVRVWMLESRHAAYARKGEKDDRNRTVSRGLTYIGRFYLRSPRTRRVPSLLRKRSFS